MSYESIYNLVPREYVTYQEKKSIKEFLNTSKEHKPLSGSTFGDIVYTDNIVSSLKL